MNNKNITINEIKLKEIKMNEYEKLQNEIKEFLKDCFSDAQTLCEPEIQDDKIIEELVIDNILIIINIIIGEFMSDILMEAYLGSNSPDYENISLRIHIHNIPNEEMQSVNIIKAFKEIYPKFEKMVKYYKTMLEV